MGSSSTFYGCGPRQARSSLTSKGGSQKLRDQAAGGAPGQVGGHFLPPLHTAGA